MKKHISIYGLLVICIVAMSSMRMYAVEQEPVFMETFDGCIDEEDENYGYTGGNDEQWGGNIATAQVIYTDEDDWDFEYANGGYQCLKVGTSKKQGVATTPIIAISGEAELSFRVAPWEGDSIFYVSVSGGTTFAQKLYHLKKKTWTSITIPISDITGQLRVTFTSTNKHRFFLDDVCVRPADPEVGVIRTDAGSLLDWGLVGMNYSEVSRTLRVTGSNLSAEGISLRMEEGEPDLFRLNTTHLAAEGGEVEITFLAGANPDMHGTYLVLSGKDQSDGEPVEKRVTMTVEVAYVSLEGSGTRPDPYTVRDVRTLAANEGTVWSGTYYWVTGYVLGGVKRYNDLFDGISQTDQQSLVLAASADETDMDKIITVQISDAARAALNVVDNPELIGQQIKVQGTLVNEKGNPLYLGKPGVRDVRTDAQYERPDKPSGIEHTGAMRFNGQAYDLLGRPVDESYRGIVIKDGKKTIVK